ncbi:MAG: hypothetical protein KGJ87_09165 [Planctomycetota bacterium]|nr:hypothetical protein [Planctomycetota bacterium]
MVNLDSKVNIRYEVNLFDERGLLQAMEVIGWIEKNGIITDHHGEDIGCSYCEGKISKKNIAAFFPGSVKVVCNKPGCFLLALKEYQKKV